MPLCAAVRRRDDDGFALVTVLGTMAVLTVILLATLTYALQNMAPSRKDQDNKAALAAAQAGIEDYLTRLNADNNYWQNPDTTNSAFSTGLALAGTGGTRGAFTYTQMNSVQQVTDTGLLRLKVNGRSGSAQRTLVANLQPVSFLKYVYFTDVEAADPTLYSGRPPAPPQEQWPVTVGGLDGYTQGQTQFTYRADPAQVEALCARRWYEGRGSNLTYTASAASPYFVYNLKNGNKNTVTDGSAVTLGAAGAGFKNGCKNINWAVGDVVDGPLHTNDALEINGTPLFKNTATETSWSATATPAPSALDHLWWGTGAPDAAGNQPVSAPLVELPDSNQKLSDSALKYGCVYAGVTRITFTGTSMKVLSPSTTTTKSGCFNAAQRGQTQTISPIPPAIYVAPTTTGCTYGAIGYPVAGESTLGATPDHACANGTAYVSGNLQGRTTLGADKDIIITGDLTYASDLASTPQVDGTDVLGLVANNDVWVYHPVDGSGNNLLPAASEVHNIQAAVLSLQHSFLVQSWDWGAPLTGGNGKLNVTGSISQKFRGAVGTSSSGVQNHGYVKNYVYDPRLVTIPPPYFLQPKQAPWLVSKTSG